MPSSPSLAVPTARRGRVVALLARALGVSALVLTFACGPSRPAQRPLPAYSGHVVALFDDGIEPAAVGITGEKRVYQPKYDPLFLERVQTADGVLRVRVVTVVSKQESRGTSFTLKLRTEKQLGGAHPPEEDFQVYVSPDAPSVGILKTLDSAIVGKRFVAFVRSFVRPDADAELHFHLAPDTKEIVESSTDATVILDGPKPP